MSESFTLSQGPPEWFLTSMGRRLSKTGVVVNEQTALQFTAVFSCIQVLSQTLASMPIILYRDRKIGDKASGKDRAVDHPLYDILKTAPNKEIPSMYLKETLMGHICSSGNGYAQIQRNRRGEGEWPSGGRGPAHRERTDERGSKADGGFRARTRAQERTVA
jgi:phage portal protein BeeE